jgi:hypothetical protein
MAFKRKQTEIPIQTKAYKFRVFPEYQQKDFPTEIKEAIFREARLMNDLWNRLVELRKSTLEQYSLIYEEEIKNAGISSEKILPAKELRAASSDFQSRTKSLWRNYEQEIKNINADPDLRAQVSWEAREDVISRFETAHKMALKAGGEIKLRSGFIRQFHFPHRFTGGGLEPEAIHRNRSKRLFIEAVAEEFYADNKYRNRLNRVTSGRFGIGLNNYLQIPFRIVLERRLPPAAKIKTVVLTGKFKNQNWEYYLVLTFTEPLSAPPDKSGEQPRALAGIDLGWRKFDDYIRFGILADSEGNLFEFRLPHDPGKTQSLRRLEKLLARHGKPLPEFPQTWQDLDDWKSKSDLETERVKELLRGLALPPAETVKLLITNLVKLRKGGLLRLLKALEEIAGEIKPEKGSDVAKALDILREWREECFSREKAINYTRDRLINNRNYSYQLLANWLKKNYARIALQSDLRLRQLAEKTARMSMLEEGGPALKNSAKFRVRVALNELLKWIKQKQGNGEEWLESVKSAKTSTTCCICGSSGESTAKLLITCGNGHEQDQDVQAAVNLRNELGDEFSASGQQIIIPDKLKDIIVRLGNGI